MTDSRLELVILGDWGRRGSPDQCRVAAGLGRVATTQDIAAVLTTGDNFYADGVRSLGDPQWIESFEAVYTSDALQVPWWPVFGNHDHRGEVAAQLAYSRRDRRWQLPAPYHAHRFITPDGAAVQTVFLDTTPLLDVYRRPGDERIVGIERCDPDRQLAWLTRTLVESRADWRIVVGHHPIHSGSPFHGGAIELQQRLLPILQDAGVHLYLAGHEHDQQHLVEHGMHFVITGAAAERRPTGSHELTVFCSDQLGFASLAIDRDAISIRLHDADGELLHRAEIEPGSPRRRRRARGRPVTVLP